MGSSITHMNEWIVGNHEDGYLLGINNLIQIFEELLVDNTLELQQQQQAQIQANDERENETVCNDFDDDRSTAAAASNPKLNLIDCTSENLMMTSEMQTENSNMNLQLEIDAMKIDQHSLQQSNRESAGGK